MAGDSLVRRLFWPVYAPSTLLGIAGGATIPVQVLAAIHLGASPSLAALVVAIIGLVGLLTTVAAGRLIDRIGDRRAMLLATIVAAVTETGSIVALVWGGRGALALFIVSSVLRAPSMQIWSLARQAFTAERVAPAEIGRAMTGLGGTMRIGGLIGPLLGGVLLLACPLWSVYVLSVGCAVGAIVLVYAPSLGGRLETPQRTAERVRDDEPALQRLAVDWMRVALAGVALGALALTRVCQPVLVQLWGVHEGLDSSHISLLIAVGAGVEIVCMFPGGYLKDRLGRAAILITCLGVYGTGILLLVALSGLLGVAGMACAIVIMAVGNGLGAGVNMTVGADLSPAVGRARFLGIWALFSNAGALAGPLLISALLTVSNEASAVEAIGLIALTGGLWVVVFGRRMALPARVQR